MKLSSLFYKVVFPFAALSAIGFSGKAEAATFSGSVAGSWLKPTTGAINDNPTYSGIGEEVFTWGDPTLFKGASANQLVFEGNSFSTDAGSLFKIGDLTYRNGTVLLGTSVDSVPLKLNLSFDQLTEVEQNFEYQFNLINTPNLSTNPELNADFLVVTEQDAKHTFMHDGNAYTLSLTGFSQDNGETQVSEFRVLEGEKTKAAIFGKIDKVTFSKKEVPEPGFPLALSVVGIYLIYRRKARKVK
ncbi:peptidase-like protein [Calothrix parasitica NIES-267]|uniref:Peptidase-like protein n=1 Tax=Calothrix parasitica NIES-267 TaxID=1973488 RepID=A0A1Z4LR93_9CYAN|nr:peptidase-like protein [Calothrix parasitica NIES-267]